ncbi:MAG TPA: hypothetical protein VFG86_18360, partial [Chloroflexota bacterium]|nr:hypothetical protein [Chloroflexota bacterium]
MATDDALSPLEFCQLQRQLVARMAMRKKRNVQMAPMQAIKVSLCEWIEAANPEPAGFNAALAEAVIAVSADAGRGSGPHGSDPHGSGPHGSAPHGSAPHGSGPHGSGPHGTGSYGTGPAQAVASDLQMDWQLACTSRGFVAWLRDAATSATDTNAARSTRPAETPR